MNENAGAFEFWVLNYIGLIGAFGCVGMLLPQKHGRLLLFSAQFYGVLLCLLALSEFVDEEL